MVSPGSASREYGIVVDARSSVGIIAALVWRPHVAASFRGRAAGDAITIFRSLGLTRRLLDDSAELNCLLRKLSAIMLCGKTLKQGAI